MAPKKKLKIGIHKSLEGSEEIQVLVDQGHDVEVAPVDQYDLVLGPNLWRANDFLARFIKNAVTAAKNTKVRRPRK